MTALVWFLASSMGESVPPKSGVSKCSSLHLTDVSEDMRLVV